jgi:multiple sugar transport system substrate-binding protein
MRKSRIIFTALLALLVLAVMIPAKAQDPVVIKISTWAGADESAEFQKILDKINDGNTEFQVVHEPIPTDYFTQVKTQLAGGTGADLYWLDQGQMSIASEGVLLPLTDCLKDAAPGTAGDVNDYYPDILSTATQDGVVYGLPWIAQPVVTYFNKNLFDAANLDYPTADWTWDDFLNDAKALTQDTDGDGKADQWGFVANGWPPPQMFIWQAGGDVISEDGMTSPIDSPEAQKGVEFYLQLAYNPEISPSQDIISEQGFGEMFKAGKIAMFMGGAADDLDRVKDLPVGVVAVPMNPDTKSNATFAWNASTAINALTQHPAEACKALLAVTEGIQNWKIVSPRISQSTVEHLVASEPRKEANAEAIIAAVPSMRAFHIIPRYAEWESAFWSDFMTPLLNKETDKTPAELAAEARPELEQFLPGAS